MNQLHLSPGWVVSLLCILFTTFNVNAHAKPQFQVTLSTVVKVNPWHGQLSDFIDQSIHKDPYRIFFKWKSKD